jgi:hypothetical protein
VKVQELHKIFSPWGKAPQLLVNLLKYSRKSGGFVSCDFEITDSGGDDALAYMGGNEEAAKQFLIFGVDGMHSLYGYWLYEGRTLETAPIVYLNGEGVGSTALANNLEDFVSLLALGKEAVGMLEAWDSSSEPCRNNDKFRAWLEAEAGIKPPKNPNQLVEKARKAHPDLQAWVEEKQAGS